MYEPNPKKGTTDVRVARAEADRLLDDRDYLLYRPGVEVTGAECVNRDHRVAIERQHCFVFGYSFFVPALRPQHLTLGKVRKVAARRRRQRLRDQPLRACDVG